MILIQNELVLIANEWNSHRIRQSAENPGGIPDVLYFLLHQNVSQSCKHPVCSDDLEAAEKYCISKPEPASTEFTELADFVMMEAGIQPPSSYFR